MPPYLVDDYDIVRFRKSKTKNKKYDALIQNKRNDKIYIIPFGHPDYQQYRDSTGLGLYSNLDHNDKARRALFRLRHRVNYDNKYYSPAYFSWNFLW
jgi:hypothetical protein